MLITLGSVVRIHLGPELLSGLSQRDWLGPVAQLGERLLCKQEVSGSIPLRSMAEKNFKILNAFLSDRKLPIDLEVRI